MAGIDRCAVSGENRSSSLNVNKVADGDWGTGTGAGDFTVRAEHFGNVGYVGALAPAALAAREAESGATAEASAEDALFAAGDLTTLFRELRPFRPLRRADMAVNAASLII